jgi:hypothetical protein
MKRSVRSVHIAAPDPAIWPECAPPQLEDHSSKHRWVTEPLPLDVTAGVACGQRVTLIRPLLLVSVGANSSYPF